MKRFKFNAGKIDPDDPGSPTNGARAAHAEAALSAFLASTGEARRIDEDAVGDLLADLLHYCDREGFDGRELIDRAQRNWRYER